MKRVHRDDFVIHYNNALAELGALADYLTPTHELDTQGVFYLGAGGTMGFAIVGGDIRYLFSTYKGKGNHLVKQAKLKGGYKLDCFDGYLVSLYSKHGFTEYKREPNWTAGEPDLVYLALGA